MFRVLDHIKQDFSQFKLTINENVCKLIHRYVQKFELTGNAPSALNSPYIGNKENQIFFTESDVNQLFDLFNVSPSQFKNVIKQNTSIDTIRLVSSNYFNLFVLWVVYNLLNSNLSNKVKYFAAFNTLKMMHYRFFTSIVNHNFIYGADPNVMEYVMEKELNMKYDIKKYGTWRRVLEIRCADILGLEEVIKRYDDNRDYRIDDFSKVTNTHIHYKALHSFVPDEAVLYILTDSQSRIRTKIGRITSLYYEAKKEAKAIGTNKLSGDIDGEKILKDISGTLDTISIRVTSSLTNIQQFIDPTLLRQVADTSSSVSVEMLKTTFLTFCNEAVDQNKANKLFETKPDEIYSIRPIGHGALVRLIIKEVYRQCAISKISLTYNSRRQIIEKTKNLFSSSRIVDPNILIIKELLTDFILNQVKIRRKATVSSLQLCVILYIVVKTFDYI